MHDQSAPRDRPRGVWDPPHIDQLPEWRLKMLRSYDDPVNLATLTVAVMRGAATLLPSLPGGQATSVGLFLGSAEKERLANADLYYATSDMTSLAVAASKVPPRAPVSTSVPPSPYGLIVFAAPIGARESDVAAETERDPHRAPGEIDTLPVPIVAAGWGPWNSPANTRVPRWAYLGPGQRRVLACDEHTRGIWITFYTSSLQQYAALDPDTVISTVGSSAMTAKDMAAQQGVGPLGWENETVLIEGQEWEAAEPDTVQEWSRVVYTAWQLMSQQSRRPLTDVTEHPRIRQGRKRDARAGVAEPAGVRVVDVHSAHRPAPGAAEADRAAQGPNRVVEWSCRWPVSPYRRISCLNPRRHADGTCEHEEQIIPGHIKGPPDKPLRTGNTVRLWSHQPQPPEGP